MINVLTVHFRSDRWVEPQLRYLARNLTLPYRTWAVLNDIDDPSVWERFDEAVDLPGSHAQKLNELAARAVAASGPDDVLLFLDGDAFPVRPLDGWMAGALRTHRLAAVRRDEAVADRQPHPCFCVTTCGLWTEIGGDWEKGPTWVNAHGEEVTDVGATLLRRLEDHGVDWLPLVRSNTHDEHPLWYGVYGHLVYHHGAGFRARTTRVGAETVPTIYRAGTDQLRHPTLEGLVGRVVRRPGLVRTVRPRHLAMVPEAARMSVAKQRHLAERRRQRRAAPAPDPLEEQVYEALLADETFYRRFDAAAG